MSDLQFESKGLILTDSPCTVDMDDGKPSRWGLSLVLAGFGGFILWAILAPLDAGVVANATDGHTLLLSDLGALAVSPLVAKDLPFKPEQLKGVTMLAYSPHILAVHPSVPANTLTELVKWLAEQPQTVRYGTSGVGNQPHLWAELLRARLNMKMENVAYKGVADTLRDVLAGHVPIIIDVVLPTGNHVAAGRLKGICVASPERSSICPTVPTVGELGMKDMESAVFYGLVAPAGVPRPIIDRLNALVQEAIKDPAVVKKYSDLGFFMTGSTPEAYLEKLKFETERWTKVVKDNNIKVEG